MPESQNQSQRARGVVDMVFLIDSTGSMQPCIDSLKENISKFIDFLVEIGSNNSTPVRNWRGKVVGFRDVGADGARWYEDNEFVSNAALLKQQLANLKAEGGGDEPESLLDSLYKLCLMEQTDLAATEDPRKWRHHHAAARVVIVFTDASFHPVMSLPEGVGGRVADVKTQCLAKKLRFSIFAPDMSCYDDLAAMDNSEYEGIPFDPNVTNGAQLALSEFTKDRANFQKTLAQLARSVSVSSWSVPLPESVDPT